MELITKERPNSGKYMGKGWYIGLRLNENEDNSNNLSYLNGAKTFTTKLVTNSIQLDKYCENLYSLLKQAKLERELKTE
jgi:hypothetical protein